MAPIGGLSLVFYLTAKLVFFIVKTKQWDNNERFFLPHTNGDHNPFVRFLSPLYKGLISLL